MVEVQFLEEYSHSSTPEVSLGAASRRTTRIRFGHGIAQLPTTPRIRVAEWIATLDFLCGGQGPVELHPFDRRVRDKREVWEEAVRVLIPMFSRPSWEWHSQFFDVPARNVIPKPSEKPHPPLWVACSNIATIASAGRWGLGALGFQFVSPDAARAWVNRYCLNLTQSLAKLSDCPTNPNIAMVSDFMRAPTDEEAREEASGWAFFVLCLSPAPGTGNMWEFHQEWRQAPKPFGTASSARRTPSGSGSRSSRPPTSIR